MLGNVDTRFRLSIDDLLGESVGESVDGLKLFWESWGLGFLHADEDGRLDGDSLEGWQFGLGESDFERLDSHDSEGLEGETSESTTGVDDDDLSVPHWSLLEELDGWVSNGEGHRSWAAVGGVDSLDGEHVGFSGLADLGDELGVLHHFGDLSGSLVGGFFAG